MAKVVPDAKSARGVSARRRFAGAVTYVAEGTGVSSGVVVELTAWALCIPLTERVVEGPVGVEGA